MLNFQLSCKRIFLSLFDAPHFELRRRFGSFSFLAWELFDFPFFLFSYYDNGMHEFLYENILNINKINISGTVTTNKAKKKFSSYLMKNEARQTKKKLFSQESDKYFFFIVFDYVPQLSLY